MLSMREKLECELVIPATDDDAEVLEETIVLHLQAEVARVERLSGGSSFGLGCRITDYTIDCEFERRLAEFA